MHSYCIKGPVYAYAKIQSSQGTRQAALEHAFELDPRCRHDHPHPHERKSTMKKSITDASARARFEALVAQMDKAIANIGRRKVTDKDQTISIPAGAGTTRVPTIGGSEVRRVSVSVAIPMDAATQRALTAALDNKCLGAAGRAAAAKLIAHIITNAPDAVLNSSKPFCALSNIVSSENGRVTIDPSSAKRLLRAVAPSSTALKAAWRSLTKYAADSAVWITHINASPSTSTVAMVESSSRLMVLRRFIL